MNVITIEIYQTVLDQLQHCQVEIDYTRYLSNKSDCTMIIENTKSFLNWSEQLTQNLKNIEQSSATLDTLINQQEAYEDTLNKLESAVDQLIHLHMEIISSCAHDADLMEGRYLIEHATGYYLDHISQHINEFRYQLNQYFLTHDKDSESINKLPVCMKFIEGVELKAFRLWLRAKRLRAKVKT